MPEPPPLPPGELERVLGRLESLVSERRVVLVGGGAVAFWAQFLSRPGLRLPVVVTSDIDVEGARTTAQRAGKLLDGRVTLPKPGRRTPLTGVVTFLDSRGHERRLDFIESPRGLTAQDVRETAVQVTTTISRGGGEITFWAMHPERSMESRVYNVVELRRTGAISLDQLKASIVSAQEFSAVVLADRSLSERARRRAVLDLNERVFRKCRSDGSFQAVYKKHGIDPFEAVLVDPRLPKEFREKRYPQMVEALDRVRGG